MKRGCTTVPVVGMDPEKRTMIGRKRKRKPEKIVQGISENQTTFQASAGG
jgi:hypothetical protein